MPEKPRGRGRPRKIGLTGALERRKVTMTYPDGSVMETDGTEYLATQFAKKAMDSCDPVLMRQALLMAQKETNETAKSAEQELKERKLLAAAKKYELENEIRKQRANQRAKKEDAETDIKRYKADQEQIKTKNMIGEYIDVGLMRYYFSFFQRGINDCFAAIKKISPDIKRLYAAGNDKQAEKTLLTELGINFANVVKLLEAEIKNDKPDT